MAQAIEGRVKELLEAPNFCTVGTVGDDGTPQVNPVWVHTEGGQVVVNSAEGRKWPRNLRRDPRVTLCVPNRENPYEYVTIWGRVVDDSHEGADEHIDFLSKKYLGQDEYPFRQPGEERVIFRIEPQRVHHTNPG